MTEYTPVPVDDAAAIAHQRDKDVVVIVSYQRSSALLHCTTYGKAAQDKHDAAALGDIAMTAVGVNMSDVRNYQDFRKVEEAARNAETARSATMLLRQLFTRGAIVSSQAQIVERWLAEHGMQFRAG